MNWLEWFYGEDYNGEDYSEEKSEDKRREEWEECEEKRK